MTPHDPQAVLVRAAQAEARDANEKALVRALFEGVPAEDIDSYRARDLAALAAGRLAFIADRRPGRAKIQISNPDGSFADVSLVDIANDDMPFLVDSILSLLNEKGLEVRLALHPVLAVKRDNSGKLETISDKSGADPSAVRESLIHIHLARIAGEEERKQLEEELAAI